MDTSQHLEIIVPLLAVNLLLALGIAIFGLISKKGRRGEFLAFAALTVCCPVIMPLFLACIRLMERFARGKEVDMNDISFDKRREDMIETPDFGMEMNYVSLQDAMRLSSVADQRQLLINVMKYNARMSLSSVAEAINSPDTETSHFAASAIQDALSEFRATAQQLLTNMHRYPEDVEINLTALEYIYQGLMMKIMTSIEHQSYVYTANSVAENLFQYSTWYMTATHYLWIVTLTLSIRDLDAAQRWVDRALSHRPGELDTYKAALRLYYAKGDKERFRDCLTSFRKSDLAADQEMLELLRLYQ